MGVRVWVRVRVELTCGVTASTLAESAVPGTAPAGGSKERHSSWCG